MIEDENSDEVPPQNVNESKEKEEVDENEAESENQEKADEDWDEEEHYEVEYVVKHRKSVRKDYPKTRDDGERCMEYYVKWKGWDPSTNTWEHEQELKSCVKLIDQYWKEREEKQQEKERIKKEKALKKKAE